MMFDEQPDGDIHGECAAEIHKLEAENAALRAELAAKQAKIDSLMLEFCPEEMTPEQMEEWARNQRPYAGDVVMVPREILDRFQELNPNNYDHDDVCNLNAWAVELVLAAAPGVQAGEKGNANVCGLPHGKEDK